MEQVLFFPWEKAASGTFVNMPLHRRGKLSAVPGYAGDVSLVGGRYFCSTSGAVYWTSESQGNRIHVS